MLITKSRIQNVAKYLANVPFGAILTIVVRGNALTNEKLNSMGFRNPVSHGDQILPQVKRGRPASRLNAFGSFIIHRDKPKKPRYMRTVEWTRIEWHGRDKHKITELRDLYRDCYPRIEIPPLSIEALYASDQLGTRLEFGRYENSPEAHKEIKTAINMALETFGQCEILDDQGLVSVEIPRRQANWEFLPEGEQPFERLEPLIKEKTKRLSASSQRVILERQKFIESLLPEACYIGQGGFGDYLAYTFPEYGFVVLECAKLGNALYIFGDDWKAISKLTKAEILNENMHLARITHKNGWQKQLTSFLLKQAA